jgi:hypothetical protein
MGRERKDPQTKGKGKREREREGEGEGEGEERPQTIEEEGSTKSNRC